MTAGTTGRVRRRLRSPADTERVGQTQAVAYNGTDSARVYRPVFVVVAVAAEEEAPSRNIDTLKRRAPVARPYRCYNKRHCRLVRIRRR